VLVIVSDSSVLIDLAKAQLIEHAFALPYEFVVPDAMFADELLDLGSYTRKALLKAGLPLGRLDGDGVAVAFGYAQRYLALSSNDAFALALAKVKGSVLLAGDGALRRAAADENVEVHGHLWLADEMESQTVARKRLLDVLEAWEDDPLVWLPGEELKTRIKRLRRRRD
jgi:predicted nucleic acid-binding protein